MAVGSRGGTVYRYRGKSSPKMGFLPDNIKLKWHFKKGQKCRARKMLFSPDIIYQKWHFCPQKKGSKMSSWYLGDTQFQKDTIRIQQLLFLIVKVSQDSVRTWGSITDEQKLNIEISENEVRKDFSKAERVEYARRLEKIESVKARERQATSTGGANPQLVETFPQADNGEVSEIVAEKLGIGSEKLAICTIHQSKFCYHIQILPFSISHPQSLDKICLYAYNSLTRQTKQLHTFT